jgi:hypothetical protein
MKTAEDVAEMLRLKACGWGRKRIARHLGCSHHTVQTYLDAGGIMAFKSAAILRTSSLEQGVPARGRADFQGSSLGRDLPHPGGVPAWTSPQQPSGMGPQRTCAIFDHRADLRGSQGCSCRKGHQTQRLEPVSVTRPQSGPSRP